MKIELCLKHRFEKVCLTTAHLSYWVTSQLRPVCISLLEEVKSMEEEEEGITLEAERSLPEEDYSKGVVFYMKANNGRNGGFLTWNLLSKMDLAREGRMLVVSYIHGLLYIYLYYT